MTASYQLPYVCYCFPQDVLTPRSWEWGCMKTERRGLPQHGDKPVQKTPESIATWGEQNASGTNIQLRGRTPELGRMPTAEAAEHHAHEQSRPPYALQPHTSRFKAGSSGAVFYGSPLAAGHITIPYLLWLKSALRAAEYCTPEGHQLILGMTSKAETEMEEETGMGLLGLKRRDTVRDRWIFPIIKKLGMQQWFRI